jgi:hypothetical protein
MNFQELQKKVLRQLGENTDAPVYYMLDDVKESINDGYEEMADLSEFHEAITTIPTEPSTIYFDMIDELSENFLAVRRAWNNKTEKWLVPCDYRFLDSKVYPRWETVLGNPEIFFTRGLWELGLYPMETEAGCSIRLNYVSIPPALTASYEEPRIPAQFQNGLVEYALYDLLAQDGKTEKALSHWKQYIQIQETFNRHVRSRLSLDRIMGVKSV